MTLQIHTARVSYRGPDRLDVTRKSGRGDALAFAPSWAILTPALEARKAAKKEGERLVRFASHPNLREFLLEAYKEKAAELEADAWTAYARAYIAEMRRSYVERRAAWDELLARTVGSSPNCS